MHYYINALLKRCVFNLVILGTTRSPEFCDLKECNGL